MRVADALAQAERAAMDPVGAGDGRLDGIDDAQASVAVSVPVEADVGFHFIEHPADESDDGVRALRRRVSNGIANRDASGAFLDRRTEKAAKCLGLRTGGVLGDVEHGQRVLSGVAHGFSRVVDHLLDRPAFGVLANRTRADEGGDLDRNADSL